MYQVVEAEAWELWNYAHGAVSPKAPCPCCEEESEAVSYFKASCEEGGVMEDLLKVLSPKMRDIAEVLLVLRDVGEDVRSILEEAETEVIEKLKEIL